MTIGHYTYISDMLRIAGYDNSCSHLTRYPEISVEDIKRLRPDHIFLSSEPYPFKAEDIAEIKKETGIESVHLVDGEYFSWYGTRALKKSDYLKDLQQHLKDK